MSNYNDLKTRIAAAIHANGVEEITGDVLQSVLIDMVDAIGDEFSLAGVATTTTVPGTPDNKTAYIATAAGTYTNFLDSNNNPIVVPANALSALLTYDPTAGHWTGTTFGTLAPGIIGTNELADGAVTTPKIADAAVTGNKLSNGAVSNANKLASNVVTTAKIATNAVTTTKIADLAVTSSKLGASSVSSEKMTAGSVTPREIATGAVSGDKIADGGIVAGKLATNSVATANIQDESVTDDKIAPNSIDMSHINSGALDDVPTSGSGKLVKSGGVHSALGTKQDTIADLNTIRTGAALGARAYQKPSGGIPESDLSASVQTSLWKADTALQASDIAGKADKSEVGDLSTLTTEDKTSVVNAINEINEKEAVNGVFSVVGGIAAITKKRLTGFIAGHVYELFLPNYSWDVSAVASSNNIFVIGYKINGTTVLVEVLTKSQAAQRRPVYHFIIPDNYDGYIEVQVRSNNEAIPFRLSDVTEQYDIVTENNSEHDAFLYKNGAATSNWRVWIDNPICAVVYSIASGWRFSFAEYTCTNLPKGGVGDNFLNPIYGITASWVTALEAKDKWNASGKTLGFTIGKTSGSVSSVSEAIGKVKFYAAKKKAVARVKEDVNIRLTPKIVCHRGFHIYTSISNQPMPENSIDAFEMAARVGYKFVEADTHPTSDGVNMILHDSSLNRTMKTSSYGTIPSTVELNSVTYDQVRSGYVLTSNDVNLRRPLPSLEEFLLCCHRNGLFPIIHIKEGMHTNASIDNAYGLALRILGKGNFAFVSIEYAYLTYARTLDADLPIIWLCQSKALMDAIPRAANNIALPYNFAFTKADLDALHTDGLTYMLYPQSIADFNTYVNQYSADWLICNDNAPILESGTCLKDVRDFEFNGTKNLQLYNLIDNSWTFNNGNGIVYNERRFVMNLAYQIRLTYKGTFSITAPNLSTTISSAEMTTATFNGLSARVPFSLELTSTADGSVMYDVRVIYTEN